MNLDIVRKKARVPKLSKWGIMQPIANLKIPQR